MHSRRRLREGAPLETVPDANQGTGTTTAPTVLKPAEGESIRRDSGPHDGDVLVTRQPGHPDFFGVRQLPAARQLRASSRELAVQLARRFAHTHAVDVWYAEDGVFRLLEAYRTCCDPAVDITFFRAAIMSAQKHNAIQDLLLRRIYGEFLEMPGLRLTCQQAQRLWGLDEQACSDLLEVLEDARFLYQSSPGMYMRLADGPSHWPPARMLTAGLDVAPQRVKAAG